MQTDNDPGKNLDASHESEEEGREKGLQWLLDMDMSEPEETLFTVKGDEYQDEGLSAFETEVAGRPLVRGNTGGDDLANYVDEEIVISSDGGSDIFQEGAADDGDDAVDDRPEVMAVDYSLGRKKDAAQNFGAVDEGADILGLQSDDDIGETFLTIKRVKGSAKENPVESEMTLEPQLTAEDATTESLSLDIELEGSALSEATAEQAEDIMLSVDEGIDNTVGLEIDDQATEQFEDLPAENDQLSCIAQTDELDGVQLSEAPVPSQIVDPGSELVANDELVELSIDESVAPALPDDPLGGALSLADAAALLQPGDGDAAEPASGIDSESEDALQSLSVDLTESVAVDDSAGFLTGDFSVDEDLVVESEILGEPAESYEFDQEIAAQNDGSIDLVEEFEAFGEGEDEGINFPAEFEDLEGVNDADAVAVAAVIPTVIQELEERVAVRAASFEMGADALAIDVKMAMDAEASQVAIQEGFAPLVQVCVDAQSVSSLAEGQAEAIYVSLVSSATQENWNHFFADNFQPPEVAAEEVVGASSQAETALEGEDLFGEFGLLQSDEPAQETANSEDDIFGADFADDLSDDFSAGFDASSDSNSDIDALFAELSNEEEMVLEDEPSGFQESDALLDTETTLEAVEFEPASEIEQESEAGDLELEALAKEEEALQPEVEVSETASIEVEADSVQARPSELEAEAIELDVVAEEAVEEFEAEQAVEPEVDSTDYAALTAMVGATDASNPKWFAPEGIKYSFTTQSNAEIFSDFLDAFIEEGSAEIEKLENLIGEWEKDISVEAHYADVCRTLHTVKGIAKGVGLQRMGTLVHNFETLLEGLPRPAQSEEGLYFRVVNIWLDALVRGIEYITGEREDIVSEIPQIGGSVQPQDSVADENTIEETGLSSIEKAVDSDKAATKKKASKKKGAKKKAATKSKKKDAPEPEVVPEADARDPQVSMLSALEKKRDKQLADEGAKVLAAQQSVRMTSEKLDLLLNLTSQAQQLGVRASQNTSRSKRSSSELQGRLTSVRTHINKIADRALFNVNARAGGSSAEMDALEMDQYSELQEAASILREGVEDLSDLIEVVSRQNIQVEALLKQQSSVISSISSSIQGARVVPVSRLMPGLRRIVRTVSTDLGKTVSFNVVNETGALDRDHYARLQTVLEHMVRNALDHGIESADDRLAAGKPMGGRITIDVRKAGGDYIIRLSDDGKGIDADAIRQSAYEKGLDVDVDELTDEEAMRLIFHKGFSTASQLSEISGRGVGMDIVLTELQQIGGDISIQSAVGLGTSFEVRIPSNVSVNGALLVAAADQNYAIPLNGLIAVEQVPVEDFFTAIEQGQSLRLFDLECEPAYLGTLCHSVAIPDRTFWDSFVPVIIAGAGNNHMAIAIDNVEEALELVVRSLGSQFSTVPGVAGAATTADGEALVALDLNLLVDSIGADGVAAVGKVEKDERQSLLALVVDDSRTQRMVATSQLETTGVETVTAENGLVAIDLLNATHRLPDVVLLDVEMPVKDGIETLREIRKSRRYGHLPVIMVTSRTGAKHRALAKEAGCNAYMGKPFNFPALIEQISELTGHEIELS